MTLNNLIEKLTAGGQFKILNKGTDVEREVTGTYCCDLLSIAMSRAPEGCAWVTVMGNINTLAVAALTDAACIILAEGVTLDGGAGYNSAAHRTARIRERFGDTPGSPDRGVCKRLKKRTAGAGGRRLNDKSVL